MRMGVDGCVWGAGDMGGHKNKVGRAKNGRVGDFCDAMTGEISPDIMFCEIGQKVKQVGVDGYGLVRMGVDGCISKGESKNKVKRGKNSRSVRGF